MDPHPPVVLSCPHCEALYQRYRDIDENGLDHWSDGTLCTDIDYNYYLDPVIRCSNCKQLFILLEAGTQNKWGWNIPKDIKFNPALPLTIDDCLEILKDEKILNSIGRMQALHWFMHSGIDSDAPETLRLSGEILMRISIMKKLNDVIRYERKSWTLEEKKLFKENANALLRIIPKQVIDKELLLLKAELYRNKRRFISSVLTLLKINSSSGRFERNRLIRLNLLLRNKLAKLNRVPFRRTAIGRKLTQLQYRIEDFFDSFRKK